MAYLLGASPLVFLKAVAMPLFHFPFVSHALPIIIIIIIIIIITIIVTIITIITIIIIINNITGLMME